MTINGRRFPCAFRTWSRIGRNYIVVVGYQPMRHAWGVDLSWGRRDLMGESVREGETRFADRFYWAVPVVWR